MSIQRESMKMFGALSREDKLMLMTAWLDGMQIECASENHDWRVIGYPTWSPRLQYRIKIQRPSINWSHVSNGYNYLFMGIDGTYSLSGYAPGIVTDNYLYNGRTGLVSNSDEDADPVGLFSSFVPGNCSSLESLVTRPGYKEPS